MSLETKSQELKYIVATYCTQHFWGSLSGLSKHIANGSAKSPPLGVVRANNNFD
jgi:hypothetical protein